MKKTKSDLENDVMVWKIAALVLFVVILVMMFIFIYDEYSKEHNDKKLEEEVKKYSRLIGPGQEIKMCVEDRCVSVRGIAGE